jgi:mono/diheme cytochrome c family protein
MSSARVFVSMLSIVVLLTACSTDDNTAISTPSSESSPRATATATPDKLAAVRINFKGHCEECHGATGNGGQVTIDGKKIKVPSLRAGHALKHSDQDFVNQISDGDDEMPAFKDKLTAEEINDLVRFIRTEFQGK